MRKLWSGIATRTTITGLINNTVLSIACTNLTGWPTSGSPFVAVIDPGTVLEEWILCDSRAANTLTVNTLGRGYVGTAQTHQAGAQIRHACDFNTIDEANRFVNLMTAKGMLVGYDGSLAQALPVGSNGLVLEANSGSTLGFDFLAHNIVPVFATMAARDALLTGAKAPVQGDLCVTTTEQRLWIHDGTRWTKLRSYGNIGRDLSISRAVTQSIPNTTGADVIFDTVVTNWDNWGVAPTASWTVPASGTGLYLCQARSTIDVTTNVQAQLLVNGVNPGSNIYAPDYFGRGPAHSYFTAGIPQGFSSWIYLVAGDVLKLNISNTSGGARTLTAPAMALDRVLSVTSL